MLVILITAGLSGSLHIDNVGSRMMTAIVSVFGLSQRWQQFAVAGVMGILAGSIADQIEMYDFTVSYDRYKRSWEGEKLLGVHCNFRFAD